MVSRCGPVITGIAVGVLAPLLVVLGNPGNMGICVACFERDIAGALGFHRAAIVQYIRPEIIGLVLGAFLSSLAFKEFKPRGGSAPAVRFFLGVFAAIGALIFLGCPWRAYLRLAGGDYNALYGIAGLFVGILCGIYFISTGYNLGRTYPAASESKLSGLMMPLFALVLLALLVMAPKFGPEGSGPVFFSEKGPGSMHAPWAVGLGVMLIIGWLAQRSRFCFHVFYIRAQVRFCQHRNGNCASGNCHRGIAGNPVDAEVLIQGCKNKHIVSAQQLWRC